MTQSPIIDWSGPVTSDSREATKGSLFAALPGVNAHGLEYLGQAVAQGAEAVLVPQDAILPERLPPHIMVIRSENIRRDFAFLAAAQVQWRQPDTVTAVTGTNGKTSVAVFTQQLNQFLGHASASLGTLGVVGAMQIEGSMTTPDPVSLHRLLSDMKDQGITHLTMEASSHGLDQNRLDAVSLKGAGFTNLTRDHLDYHGDVKSYFLAKKRLFTDLLNDDSLVVIYRGDRYSTDLAHWVKSTGMTLLECGADEGDFAYSALTPTTHGCRFLLSALGRSYEIDLPIIGSFQVQNLLVALGLTLAGVEKADWSDHIHTVIPYLSHIRGVPGRMEVVDGHPKGAGICVDYAHTPDALKTALHAARPHSAGRLICVYGCGGDRDAGKRPLMTKAVVENADIAILTDDNPRSEDPALIRADAMQGFSDVVEIAGRQQAIEDALSMAQSGDLVLIAGKGHEQGQMIQGVLHPFDDRDVARHWVEEQT